MAKYGFPGEIWFFALHKKSSKSQTPSVHQKTLKGNPRRFESPHLRKKFVGSGCDFESSRHEEIQVRLLLYES